MRLKYESDPIFEEWGITGDITFPSYIRMLNSRFGMGYIFNNDHLSGQGLGFSLAVDLEYSFYKAIYRKPDKMSLFIDMNYWVGKVLEKTDSNISRFSNSFNLLWAFDQRTYHSAYFTSNLEVGIVSRNETGYDWVLGTRFILTPLSYKSRESFLNIVVSPFAEKINRKIIVESLVNLPAPLVNFYVKIFYEYKYLNDNSDNNALDKRRRSSFGISAFFTF